MISEKIRLNIVRNRRNLHQIPELGFQEFKTQEYLIKELENMGYSPKKICQTGVYVYIDNNKENTYAFRSDIDALPILEENNIPFASKHPGVMHACGHDGHMATLLAFGEYLSEIDRNSLNHNILLIFQPAEESPGGAKDIVESGLLEKYFVKKIFGLHLFPKLNEGVVGSRAGGFMARASEINVDILGKSGHCGQPQNGIDSIQLAMKFLDSINFLKSKGLSPFDPTLISFNRIVGGTVRNITAENTRLEGTIRSYSEDSFNFVVESLKNIGKGLELSFGGKFHFDIASGYPPVVNDNECYQIFKDSLKDEKDIEFMELEPEMLAEDFSFYQKAVPGLFYYVGVGSDNVDYVRALHNCRFNFNESALLIALKTYIKLNERLNKIEQK